jgi:pimeloyl-ACP methyl ester carboxylesterase
MMDMKLEIRPHRTIRVSVEENPESVATLFLIHGLGGRGDQWRKQIKVLKQHYTLIIPDLLGHGKSDKPRPGKTNPYDFMEFSADLQVLFDKFAGDKNVLIGHSYGGALVTYLTYNNLTKVSRQILIAPSRCKPFRGIPKIYRLPLFILEILRPLLENAFRNSAFDKNALNKVISEEYQAGKRNRLYVIKSMLLGMRNIPDIDITKISTPSLILIGKSDHVIPSNLIREFYTHLPQHEFVVIEPAGHMLQLEQPEKVNHLFAEFLYPLTKGA